MLDCQCSFVKYMRMDFYDNDVDDEATSIINQIMNQSNSIQKVAKEKEPPPTVDNLDEFVIKHSTILVQNALEVIEDLKTVVQTDKEMIGMAELFKAATSAIETLSKLNIAKEKNKTSKAIKQMDIDAKKQIVDNEIQGRLTVSRDELMKALVDHGIFDKNKEIEKENNVIDI